MVQMKTLEWTTHSVPICRHPSQPQNIHPDTRP